MASTASPALGGQSARQAGVRRFHPQRKKKRPTMLLALSLLIGVALAQPGRFNSKLTFTGNVEVDFATNGVLKRGVVLLKDETPSANGPISQPDVGLPPTPQWVGLLSGWDIKDIHFQFDFEYAQERIFFFFFSRIIFCVAFQPCCGNVHLSDHRQRNTLSMLFTSVSIALASNRFATVVFFFFFFCLLFFFFGVNLGLFL
jgi:hypothetical protein